MLEKESRDSILNHPMFAVFWFRLDAVGESGQARKLLFICAIFPLDDDALSKRVFVERAVIHLNNANYAPLSVEWSIVDDLLSVVDIFKLNNEVSNMVLRGHVYPKSVWKQMVWDCGWSLEDTYWSLEARLHREMDLLNRICPSQDISHGGQFRISMLI